jgi:hypothetical protein
MDPHLQINVIARIFTPGAISSVILASKEMYQKESTIPHYRICIREDPYYSVLQGGSSLYTQCNSEDPHFVGNVASRILTS